MLFADGESIGTVGGVIGTLGGVTTALGAIYVIWEKISKRKVQERKELVQVTADELKVEEQKIQIEVMAREKIAEAYDQLMKVRKAERDEQIARLQRDIDGNKKRLVDLERREQACQELCATLTADSERKDDAIAALREQNAGQAKEIAALQAKIEKLERQLREAKAIPPGTDLHKPLP